MQSIKFPKMLSSTTANLVSDHEATAQNLVLLLRSDRQSLLGDPYYGTVLKRLLFEQNNIILKDIIIDEIYSSIVTFMPQISLTRNDIQLKIEKDVIYVTISCVNLIDKKPNLYTIKLTEITDED